MVSATASVEDQKVGLIEHFEVVDAPLEEAVRACRIVLEAGEF